jgi:hypothetical protein
MNEEQNNLYVKLHEDTPLICMSYIQPLIKDPTQVSTVFVDDNDFYLSNKEIQAFIRLINLHCKREKAIGEWLRYAQGLKHGSCVIKAWDGQTRDSRVKRIENGMSSVWPSKSP